MFRTLHWRQGSANRSKTATAIPPFEPYDIHADGAIAQRWRKWIKCLKNLFVAAAIGDRKRQRALLLYYTGEEVSEIFDTLPDTGEDFETAKTKLNEYFDPEKNVEFEIYTFRQVKQTLGETMNSYHSRLRQLAATCEFNDIDKEEVNAALKKMKLPEPDSLSDDSGSLIMIPFFTKKRTFSGFNFIKLLPFYNLQ